MNKFPLVSVCFFSFFCYSATLHVKDENIVFSSENFGTFNLYPKNNKYRVEQNESHILYSPKKDFAIIQKYDEGYLWLENGDKKFISTNYCDVVNMHNGCIITTLDGQACGAKWVDNNQITRGLTKIRFDIKTPVMEIIRGTHVKKMSSYLPNDILSGKVDGLDYSLESYSQCYDLTQQQRDKLENFIN